MTLYRKIFTVKLSFCFIEFFFKEMDELIEIHSLVADSIFFVLTTAVRHANASAESYTIFAIGIEPELELAFLLSTFDDDIFTIRLPILDNILLTVQHVRLLCDVVHLSDNVMNILHAFASP